MEGVFIAHWLLITFEKGGKEQLPEGSGFIFIVFVYQKSEICLQFWCNENFPNAPLNPIAALNLERLLSARLRYITAAFQILKTDSSLDIYA